MPYLIALSLLAVAGWYWLDSARARELATELARSLCERHGIQFLDETVSLTRTGLRWTGNGLRIRRLFTIDYNIGDPLRRHGYVLLLGTAIESVDLGLPQDGDEKNAQAKELRGGKVIRFPDRQDR